MVKRVIFGAAGLLWVAGVTAGLSILFAYDNTSGTVTHDAPAYWPADSRLPRVPGRPMLVMLVHPQCPCSRASVGELARLMAQAPGSSTTQVLFHKPAGVPADWHRTDLWNTASAIPGVTVSVDQDGIEARRFGIATSGHTLLYDSDGRLRFSGGITASRGHSGDNAGRAAIVALLQQRAPQRHSTSVFGCSLLSRCASCPNPAGAPAQ